MLISFLITVLANKHGEISEDNPIKQSLSSKDKTNPKFLRGFIGLPSALIVFFATEVKRSKTNKKLINDPKVTPSVFFLPASKKKCR
jgi:hypothetical protein